MAGGNNREAWLRGDDMFGRGPLRATEGLGDLPAGHRFQISGGIVRGAPGKPKAMQVRTPADILGTPTPEVVELVRAMARFIADENIFVTEFSPHMYPPFRGIGFDAMGQVVLDFVGGAGSEAATQIQTGLGPPTTTSREVIPIPTNVGVPFGAASGAQTVGIGIANPSADICSFEIPAKHIAVLERYGWDLPTAQAHQQVEVQLMLGSRPLGGVEKYAFTRGNVSNPAWTFALIKGNVGGSRTVSLQGINRSTLVPYEITGRIAGWHWPVNRVMDNIEGLLLRTKVRS